jgi:hypothetical protein
MKCFFRVKGASGFSNILAPEIYDNIVGCSLEAVLGSPYPEFNVLDGWVHSRKQMTTLFSSRIAADFFEVKPIKTGGLMSYNEGYMTHFELNHRVGNYRTNKVGSIASAAFKGAGGEFKGYLVLLENNVTEMWDESSMVTLPKAPTEATQAVTA